MKKKILIGIISGLLFASAGYTAPNTDFKKSDIGISAEYRTNVNISAGGFSFDAKSGFNDYSLTYGISDKMALQFRSFITERESGGSIDFINLQYNNITKYNSQEFNALYKLTPKLNTYLGINKIYPKISGTDHYTALSASYSYNAKGIENNCLQAGLVYAEQLNSKTDTYILAGFGKDLYKWQIGLTYKFNPNISFDVNYQQNKFDDVGFNEAKLYEGPNVSVSIGSQKTSVKIKSIGWGFNYKF